MKQLPIKSHYKGIINYHDFPDGKEYESSALPSLTVPDQTMGLREILERHQKGLPISGGLGVPMYYGDEIEIPDLKKLDLSERMDLIEAHREHIKEMQDNMQEQKIARQMAAKKLRQQQQEQEVQFEEQPPAPPSGAEPRKTNRNEKQDKPNPTP